MRGLFKSRGSKESESINSASWLLLESESQFLEILEDGAPFFIFKHSPRCSISVVAKNRIEKQAIGNSVPVYLVDVVSQRSLSQFVASKIDVVHQSPQLIKLDKGVAVFDASHMSISANHLVAE
jgi:bacillithiol system protein YtxJ